MRCDGSSITSLTPSSIESRTASSPCLGGTWIGRGLEIEIDLIAIDRQPAVIGIDPAPGFAVLPGQRLAGESGRPVEPKIEARNHPLPGAMLRHSAPNAKPRGAPRRAPRIANVDRRELSP